MVSGDLLLVGSLCNIESFLEVFQELFTELIIPFLAFYLSPLLIPQRQTVFPEKARHVTTSMH